MDLFPELNLEHLKKIVFRWIEQYSKRGACFPKVILYRYAHDYLSENNHLKYVIVFYFPPDQLSIKDLKSLLEDGANFFSRLVSDPYLYFLAEAGFFHFLTKHDGWDIGMPNAFWQNDFDLVYRLPQNDFDLLHRLPQQKIRQEWIIIPSIGGDEYVPSQVRLQEKGVVLYSAAKPGGESSKQALLEKYKQIAITFCKTSLSEKGETPKRSEVQGYLEKNLKESKESLGVRAPLPETVFREIYNAIPDGLKRPIGKKSR